MINLTKFRILWHYSRLVFAKYRGDMGRPERRLAIIGAIKLAFAELNMMKNDEHYPDMPLHVLALRDFTSYLKYEVDTKWFKNFYGEQGVHHVRRLIEECESELAGIGVSVEIQPDWREETFKLYKYVRFEEIEVKLNPTARSYLSQRYKDEE